MAATVLYIYNEIQIRISRTVSLPRVTVWILLTLISWIMLIFTLSAHRQQTPHDMGVVTAASVCCRVYKCVYGCIAVCVLEWLPCCQTDLHVKGWSNYITYANEKCTRPCTYIHTMDSLVLRSKRQLGLLSYWLAQGGITTCQIDMSWHNSQKLNCMLWYTASDKSEKRVDWSSTE